MEGTGGTSAPKGEKTGNSIPKDNYRFIPAISEQGLGEKPQKKKLQSQVTQIDIEHTFSIYRIWKSTRNCSKTSSLIGCVTAAKNLLVLVLKNNALFASKTVTRCVKIAIINAIVDPKLF